MTYRTTRQADQDIIDLYVRGAVKFGADQAESYHLGLAGIFELLADNPYLARERSEFIPPIRLHPYRSHLVVYVVKEEGVLIVRVLHGRQEWERFL
ncbi:MAG TPA: type II toxin-antitoxin system RelE/ParE family toxin [Modicisalibacter sp.]|nr:type II toxin-antitoxin system RelE/ParE family toxin [Modicisalibacter sp.]